MRVTLATPELLVVTVDVVLPSLNETVRPAMAVPPLVLRVALSVILELRDAVVGPVYVSFVTIRTARVADVDDAA